MLPFIPEPFVLSSAIKKPCKLEYQIIMLRVVLHGCETWFLLLREEHRPRVFENRVLRRIFQRKRNEVTGGWINCIRRSFITCTLWNDQVKEDKMGRECSINE
jgi:hypothetical protein